MQITVDVQSSKQYSSHQGGHLPTNYYLVQCHAAYLKHEQHYFSKLIQPLQSVLDTN